MERVDNYSVFSSSLVAYHPVAPGILEVRIERPAGFTFLPGQFIRFYVDDVPRDYTIISAPHSQSIDFCIALVEGGRFSTLISRAMAGDTFKLSGPHGHFIYNRSANKSIFVATGVGVAPYVSFCRSGIKDAMLIHGVSTPDKLIYRRLLQPHLGTYIPCISQQFEKNEQLGEAYSGRVTDYLKTSLPQDTYDFYLCGQRNMIRDATALIDDNFEGSRLFIENFE